MSTCPWCQKRHGENHLCEPAKKILAALVAQASQNELAPTELPDPITGIGEQILGEGAILIRMLTATAISVDVAGDAKPGLVLSGQGEDGAPLPRWVYIGNDDEITRAVGMIADVAEMAIGAANSQRGENRT